MLEMHDWFVIWQRNFAEIDKHWKIGHVVARAEACTWKTSLERTSLKDASKPWLRAIRLVKEGSLEDPLIQVAVVRRVSAG
jgi:hypothetical protein